MTNALIKQGRYFQNINLSMFFIILIANEFNGIVGFDIFEHHGSKVSQLFLREDIDNFEIYLKHSTNISWILFPFSSLNTFL